LFSGPVESVKVCGYTEVGSATESSPRGVVLTGQRADELTASLDSAATSRPAIACPVPADLTTTLVVIGLSRSGVAMRPVVVPLICGGLITNGSAIRYNWKPPADLASSLPLDTAPGTQPGVTTGPVTIPPGGPVAPSGGRATGSPIR
jgi:hypothetical protein